jgi:hypothetical protein
LARAIPNSRIAISRHRIKTKNICKACSLSLSHYAASTTTTMVKTPPAEGSDPSEPTLPTTEDRSPNGSVPKPRKSQYQSALSYLKNEISLEYADIPIIACCLASGLCDSSAYNAWSCFVSMQTGLCFLPLSTALTHNHNR